MQCTEKVLNIHPGYGHKWRWKKEANAMPVGKLFPHQSFNSFIQEDVLCVSKYPNCFIIPLNFLIPYQKHSFY